MRMMLIAALAALAATPALAQPNVMNSGRGDYRPNSGLGSDGSVRSAAQSAERQFRGIDIHRDGQLTRSEWGAAGLTRPDFAILDVDKDGKVSLEEFTQGLSGRAPEERATASSK